MRNVGTALLFAFAMALVVTVGWVSAWARGL
jgi:hypothetical protein